MINGTDFLQNGVISIEASTIDKVLLEGAKKIYGEDYLSNISGFFGYNMEMISLFFRNEVIRDNLMFDESFLVTARKDESKEKIATMFGYTQDKVTPTLVRCLFALSLTNTDLSNPQAIMINSDTTYILGDKEFTLNGVLTIEIDDEGKHVVVLVNVEDGIRTPLSSKKYVDNGITYFTFLVELEQKTINKLDHIVGSRDTNTFYKIELEKSSSLVGIRAYVKDSMDNKVYLKEAQRTFAEIDDGAVELCFMVKDYTDRYEIWLDNGSYTKFIESGTRIFIEVTESSGYIGDIINTGDYFSVDVQTDLIPRVLEIQKYILLRNGVDELKGDDKTHDIISYIQTPNKTPITIYDFKNLVGKLDGVSDVEALVSVFDTLTFKMRLFITIRNSKLVKMLASTISYGINTATANTVLVKYGDVFLVNTTTGLVTMTNTVGLVNKIKNLNSDEKMFISPFILMQDSNPTRLKTYSFNLVTDTLSFKQRGTTMVNSNIIVPAFGYIDCLVGSDLINNKMVLKFDISFGANDVNGFNDGLSTTVPYYIDENNKEIALPIEISNKLRGSISVVIKVSDTVSGRTFVDFYTEDGVLLGINYSYRGTLEFRSSYNGHVNSFICRENIELFEDYSEIYGAEMLTGENLQLNALNVINVLNFFDLETETISENSTKDLSNIYRIFKEVDTEVRKITTQPSNLELSFMNTSGKITSNINASQINVADFKLELEISYEYNVTNTIAINESVKSLIIEYIDKKQNDFIDQNIYLSDIINLVIDSYSEIRQIRILNFYDNIYINTNTIDLYSMSRDELRSYVPTKLLLTRDNISITTY